MTDSLFFDSDCISAFLWVGNENLLVKLYPGRIVIPKTVYDELSYPGIAHLKARVDALLSVGQAQVMSIDVATEAYAVLLTSFCGLTLKSHSQQDRFPATNGFRNRNQFV